MQISSEWNEYRHRRRQRREALRNHRL